MTEARLVGHCLVRTIRPVNVACWQSVPVKSASIRDEFAVPTLPKVPRQPRGESNCPCVLIWAGGVPVGVRDVVADVAMRNHACSDCTVVRNACWLLFGTVSNVHCVVPLVGGTADGSPGFTSIVTVPRQVPARNDTGPEGDIGPGEDPPQAVSIIRSGIGADASGLVTGVLLPVCRH
jgi:hypothetical protein